MASSSTTTKKTTTTTKTSGTDNITGYNAFEYNAPEPTYTETTVRPQEYVDPYQAQRERLLNQSLNYGDFSYADAPEYTNQYAQMQQQYLNNLLNREAFSYTPDTDPVYDSYAKAYQREGQRATANTLAQASAATGGRPSSYAVSAATQAGNYYASQLSDKIPELYQQAYQRYLNEYQMKQSDLSAINTQEQLDYKRYLTQLGQYNTDRSQAYNEYLNGYNRLQSDLGTLNAERDYGTNAYLAALQQYNQDRNYDLSQYELAMNQYNTNRSQAYQEYLNGYQQWQNERTLMQEQIDAMLASGGTPTPEQLAAAGYTGDYASALAEAYARQQARADADWYAQYGDYSLLGQQGVDTSYLRALQNAELAQLGGYSLSGGGSGGRGGRGGSTNSGGPGDNDNTEEIIAELEGYFPGRWVRNFNDWQILRNTYGDTWLKDNGFRYYGGADLTAAAAGISPNTSGITGTDGDIGADYRAALQAAEAGISPYAGRSYTGGTTGAGTNNAVVNPKDLPAVTPKDVLDLGVAQNRERKENATSGGKKTNMTK